MENKKKPPPKIPQRLFRRLFPPDDKAFLCGDLEEIYHKLREEQGEPKARIWYWRQCLQSIPRILARVLTWRLILVSNFLKVALRNFKRKKVYSLVNIAGFAVGMSVVLAIFLFIRHERGFDGFHRNADRIYRLNTRIVMSGNESVDAVAAPAVAPALRDECPEIERATRLFKNFQPLTIRAEGKSFSEKDFFYVDTEFFDVFSFTLIEGDPATVFSTPQSLVLTESTARKYFSSGEALGKILTVSEGPEKQDFIVRGIAADVPGNSHFSFDFLARFSEHELSRVDNWFLRACRTYVLLHEGTSPESLEARFPALIEKGAASAFQGQRTYQDWISEGNSFDIFLQPLKDIHLLSRGIGAQIQANGNIAYVNLFGFIGLFVLMIAVFNYVNMATAHSINRGHEVGVRKIIGSTRSLLVRQFLLESILTSLISFSLAVCLVLLALPSLRALIERDIQAASLLNWPLLPGLILLAVLIGALAGAYPAFILSSYNPARMLRRQHETGQRAGIRRNLVIFQFTLSILMAVITVTVHSQMRYVRAKDLGFEKENLLALPTSPEILKHFDSFKAGLEKDPDILSVSLSAYIPGRPIPAEDFGAVEGSPGIRVNLSLIAGGEDFADTLGLEILEGRFHQQGLPDTASHIVINQSAARKMNEMFGWETPLDKAVTTGRETFTVIGIVRDFHFDSLHSAIQPLALIRLPPRRGPFVAVRIRPSRYAAARSTLKETWENYTPQQTFIPVSFTNETEQLYRSEQRTAKMMSLFSLLAILLGCLGLMGLAAFSSAQRSREIGIRKVFGAREGRLVLMLVFQHTRWILASNIVAWPIAYIVIRKWLENFAFRTEIHPLLFGFTGGMVFVLACLTVFMISLRAASTDPGKILKYE